MSMPGKLKKIFLFSFLLIVALFAMNALVLHLLITCPKGNIAKINEVMLHKLDYDVTIWGSSTALVNFDADAIGEKLNLSCFNVGLNGTPFVQYSGLLSEYLSYSEKKKLLIIVVDINGFASRDALYQGHAWLHHLHNDNIYQAIKTVDKDLAVKSRYVPLYYLTAYDRSFLYQNIKWIYLYPDGKSELDNHGFRPQLLFWQEKKQAFSNESLKLTIEKSVVDRMRSVLNQASKLNIRVVVVVPPCYHEATKRITNREEFEDVFTTFSNENIKVFNYLDSSFSMDRVNFYNYLHLNAQGASVFTRKFSEDIQRWMDPK